MAGGTEKLEPPCGGATLSEEASAPNFTEAEEKLSRGGKKRSGCSSRFIAVVLRLCKDLRV
ncbi:hypothetical protein QUB80_13285 [Chlorogloeopsis sp. ULAP01]|uniref:hypothetical protein n=1 Tax=Chlorogloeopsis sp. ULAP01 TaxID=3056483 RepID=UPI0025AB05D4|nr:hypothetical protein [Chlorogloeopsis sp. ULAP01]MDM9381676.1 hypothetical protein [Chlorogloeopsis sp. ULAP01]